MWLDFLMMRLYFGYVLVTIGNENTRKNKKNRRPPEREKTPKSKPEVLENQGIVFKKKWGGRWDLNPRPPGPQPGALTN